MIGAIFMKLGRAPTTCSIRFANEPPDEVTLQLPLTVLYSGGEVKGHITLVFRPSGAIQARSLLTIRPGLVEMLSLGVPLIHLSNPALQRSGAR
jgi:hypothetical protein